MPCALAGTAATQSMAPAARAIASFFMQVPPFLLGLPGATNRVKGCSRLNSISPTMARRYGAPNLSLVPASTEVPPVMEARVEGEGAEPGPVPKMSAMVAVAPVLDLFDRTNTVG